MGLRTFSSRNLAPACPAAFLWPKGPVAARSQRSMTAPPALAGPACSGRLMSAGLGVRHQRPPEAPPALGLLPRRWMATADAPFSSKGQDLVCMRDLRLRL